MKICWDNLESLRFSKQTGKWYKKTQTLYESDEPCLACGEIFLYPWNKKYPKSRCCDYECRSIAYSLYPELMPWYKGGIASDIKKYKRAWHLLKNYGLTIEDYNKILGDQNNKCPICDEKLKVIGINDVRKPNIDHCHVTGKVRGILCHRCNKALGLLRDDIQIIERALNYIRKSTRGAQNEKGIHRWAE